ncbi:hypothetical protein, partial [Nostoc sp. UCD120]|uniref:hypothetical protein n=1 Tax=Nostoc sp. UCD120 TaxID=2681312 RepID=UPI001C8A7E1C
IIDIQIQKCQNFYASRSWRINLSTSSGVAKLPLAEPIKLVRGFSECFGGDSRSTITSTVAPAGSSGEEISTTPPGLTIACCLSPLIMIIYPH